MESDQNSFSAGNRERAGSTREKSSCGCCLDAAIELEKGGKVVTRSPGGYNE
jgi:hypothetical protein